MVMQGIGGRKLAATVLLVRDGIINGRPDVEVYIQERVSTMANFPRATVFPGGGVDSRDFADGNHEAFADMAIPQVIAGGERHKDMALRLKVAGIEEDKLTEVRELDEVIEQIATLPTENVYILATYTAVLQLRKKLAEKGYIKGGMDRG